MFICPEDIKGLWITQFIQGFTRKVLDEPNHEVREKCYGT